MQPDNKITMSDSVCQYVGCRVKIKLKEDEIEGTVKSVDTETKRISLEKSVSLTRNKKKKGVLNFYRHEILSLEILDEHRNAKLDKDDTGATLLGKKMSSPHLDRMQNLEPGKLTVSRGYYSCDEDTEETKQPSQLKLRKVQFSKELSSSHHTKDRPDCYIIVDQIDEQYEDIMWYLYSQSVLSICLEGIMLGRDGKLCWIQVASKEFIFMFDVCALGQDCFSRGLVEILTSSSILKIIHDCRFASDILFHQYDIKLVNIFDTQVADVLIYRMKHRGDLPRYVHSLGACLFLHLSLSGDMVDMSRVRAGAMEEDQAVWKQRPLPHYLVMASIKHVIFLRELRLCLMEKMMTEFVCGVDIYLDVIRNSKQGKIVDAHLLPENFIGLSDMASYRIDYIKGRRSSRRQERGPNGFRENCIGVVDPSIIYSHDSIWHQGKKVAGENYSDVKKKEMTKSASTSAMSPLRNRSAFSSFGCSGNAQTKPHAPTYTAGSNAKMSPLMQASGDTDPETEPDSKVAGSMYKSYSNHELLTGQVDKRRLASVINRKKDDMGMDFSLMSLGHEEMRTTPNKLSDIDLTHFQNDIGCYEGDKIEEQKNSIFKDFRGDGSTMRVSDLQDIPDEIVLKPAGALKNNNPRKKKSPHSVIQRSDDSPPKFVVPQMNVPQRSKSPVGHLNTFQHQSPNRPQNNISVISKQNVHQMQGVQTGVSNNLESTSSTPPGRPRTRPSPRQLLLETLGLKSKFSPPGNKESPSTEVLIKSESDRDNFMNDSDLDMIPGPSCSTSHKGNVSRSDESDDQGFNSESDFITPVQTGRGRGTLCRFTV